MKHKPFYFLGGVLTGLIFGFMLGLVVVAITTNTILLITIIFIFLVSLVLMYFAFDWEYGVIHLEDS